MSSLNQSRQPLLQHFSYYQMDPSGNLPQIVDQLLKQASIECNFKHILEDPLLDRALGSMFGSIIGDALGSYIQFQPKPTPEIMELVMQMPGGGTFGTKPGQGTDDTEMSLCLLHSLLHYDPTIPLSQQTLGLVLAIYHSYIAWSRTQPFDIGITTQTGIQMAVSVLQNMFDTALNPQELKQLVNRCQQAITAINYSSQSNSYLMRCHPMAIFKAFLKRNKIPESLQMNELISSEILATHSHAICLESGGDFIEVIASLIARPNFGAVREIYERWTENKGKSWQWKALVMAKKSIEVTEKIGWAKIAYTEAFNQLRQVMEHHHNENNLTEEFFTQIMKQTIEKGGDTDTNAAIVGAMVGAVFGFSKLPAHYLIKILQLRFPIEEFTQEGHKKTCRPPFFEPRNALINVIKLKSKFHK